MEDSFIQLVPAKQLVDMLPSSTDEAKFISAITAKCRAWYKTADKELKAAQSEDESRKPLITYLDKIFEEFPAETRSCAADASNTRPATSIDDITNAGLVVEFELQADIFDEDGRLRDCPVAREDVKKLEKRALSLLAIHGRCHVYVVAVFNGRMTRIFRFDRGGFIATDAFNWLADKKLIPTFLYRLYNAKPRRMYGDDDTISVPSAQVKQNIFNRLQETDHYKTSYPTLEAATKDSHRIKAVLFYMDTNPEGRVTRKGKVVDCLSFGTPLSAADGLVGRATNVYRVVLEDDLNNTKQPLAFYALKDSWRLACRRPEVDFYDAIEHHCSNADPPVDMESMARCRGSVDLGEPSEDWDSALHRSVFLKNERLERRHMRALLTPVGLPLKNFKSQKALCQALYTVVLHLKIAYEAGVLHRDVSEGNVLLQEASPDKGFLLDWDYAEFTPEGLQRFHAAFKDREPESKRYRNIEKSLKDFTGTEPFVAIEIIKAARPRELDPQDDEDAGGEEEATEMNAGESNDGSFIGEQEADEGTEKAEDAVAENSETKDVEEEHSEETPTDLTHDLHHDLESVFWLLIWIILRHTDHGHPSGALACVELFAGNAKGKVDWVFFPPAMKTGPLFQLAEDLRRQVLAQYASRALNIEGYPPQNLTPDKFRAAFKKCLDAPWTSDDQQRAIPYRIPHKVPEKNNTVTKESQSLFRKFLVDNRQSLPSNIQSAAKQGSKGKSAVAQGSKAEPAASTGSKRGRPTDNESPPTEPKAAGLEVRKFKKARRSEVAVDDAEEMQGGVDEEGEMDVEGDEGEEMDVEAPPPVTTRVLRSATKHDSGEEKGIVKPRKKKVADVRAGGSSGKKKSNSRRR
ncbi:hypothetical protein R3P38DRAFT_3271928 [Favolaschia claudopus]|uniref:Fungal-type protein kinase domain-containing protein n=1 Tax=Favolaschia claudopus TaxID=2862362 RepID=A0AAW0B6I1_9AGAR